jgi:multidrug efflux pump
MQGYLSTMQGLENLEDTRPPAKIEYQMVVDKVAAMKYGVDTSTISAYVKLATNGVLIDKFSQSHLDEKTEIILRYPEASRNVTQILNSFIILNGRAIPLKNFVTLQKQKELGEVIKKNGKLMNAIKANIKEKYTDENGEDVIIIKSKYKDEILKKLKEIASKHSVSLVAAGSDEDQQETGAFLQKAFGLALVVIFLIFVIEFNSIGFSLIILSSVFLSIVGVFLGLTISQQAFSIVMCGLGVISLAGIVVSNNLIYLDFFQSLTKSGVQTNEALIKAAILRGKAIILTSGTNVIGLVPAMFGMNIDFATGLLTIGSPTSQWWIQLSSTIAGGLTFATALTLFFTPSNTLLCLKFKGYVMGGSNKLRAYFKWL